LRDGEARVAVGTVQAFGTGIDIPSIEVGIVALPVFTNKPLLTQIKGRFCRPSPGKTQGTLYALFDENVFNVAQVAEIAKRFPDRVFAEVDGKRMAAEAYVALRRAAQRERERTQTGGLFD